MRLLIPTQSGDVHAKVVQRVLGARGHDVTLWYTSDLPQRGTATLELGGDGGFHPVLTSPNGVVEGPFDVFWLRRPTQAVLPDGVHPADRHFVETEWLAFQKGLKSVVAPNAFWVNPFDAAYRAERKAVQLATAAQVGLRVPPTLMSNDPARIRDFIRRQPGETIYKPFRMVSWDGQETSALTYTSVISEADLDDEEVVQWTPGIFQPRIDKSHELRVTIMGETMFVSRLESQAHADGKVDWRGVHSQLSVLPASLPPQVEASLRALVAQLGLVFGCADFIVTPSGDHVFLEINQQGQFLWLEMLAPDLPILDAFCSLLEAGRPDHGWRPSDVSVRLSDVFDEAADAALDAAHVPTPTRFVIPEAEPASVA